MRKNIGYVKKSRLKTKAGSKRQDNGSLPKLLWFIYPAIYILLIQCLAFGSVIDGIVNTILNPYSLILSYLLVIGISFVLWLFFENKWVSFSILNVMGFIVALGNRFTIPKGETGLAISNLGIFNELGLIQNAEFTSFLPFIVMLFFFIPLLYYMIYLMYQWKAGLKNRYLAATGALVAYLLISQLFVPFISTSRTTLANVNKQGAILFFNNGLFGWNSVKYPSMKQVAEIMADVDVEDRQGNIKPNVIMLQVTNLVDIERVLGIKTAAYPSYEQLKRESSRYIVDLSTRQKDNLNIEFEVLAGLPVEFHPNDAQIREGNTTKGTISLGSIMSGHGYESVSILPYESSKRDEFYKNIGFDRFVNNDTIEKGQSFNVIEEIGKKLNETINTDKPVFIYGHLNILDASYEEDAVKNYMEDLNNLEHQLSILKEKIQATKDPTVLLIYSDKLPKLGTDNKVYYEAGYLENKDSKMEAKKKMNSGDLFFWNNYNLGTSYKNEATFDLADIPFMMLQEVGLSMPEYLHYVRHLYEKEKLSRVAADYLEIDGILFSDDTKEYKRLTREFSVIIKDVLGPNKYVEENLKKWSK